MELAVDLHIHSALSPCAENDMTPANIVNMAYLKGLDAIAIADHNACFNLEAAKLCADQAGLLFLPGIEVTTAEEVHILVYFDVLQNALDFGKLIYESLPDIDNMESLFGEQIIFDADDKFCGKAKKLLAQATPYTINALKEIADDYKGLLIPAHINREAYSILNNLGFIPPGFTERAVEVRRNLPLPHDITKQYKLISSSDAHSLGQILERTEFVQTKNRSIPALMDALRK